MHNLIEEQAEIHQVLSNPSRLLILRSLAKKEMSVGEIAEQIGASLQNTSQHLRLMKDKDVLEARREGQTIFYQIAVNEMGERCKRLLTCLETHNQPIYQEA
jgi:DNA-binding transcriptional ArsR family regulator